MKKTYKSIQLFFSLAFLSILFYQCCDDNSFGIVGNGDLTIEDLNSNQSDTISNTFEIYNRSEVDVINTPCGNMRFINSILENSVQLTFSEDFEYNQNILAAGTDVLSLGAPTSEIELVVFDGDIQIVFKDEFIGRSSFGSDEYEITLNASTDDDVEIINSLRTYFNFN
jgi:hypothetical protein